MHIDIFDLPAALHAYLSFPIYATCAFSLNPYTNPWRKSVHSGMCGLAMLMPTNGIIKLGIVRISKNQNQLDKKNYCTHTKDSISKLICNFFFLPKGASLPS